MIILEKTTERMHPAAIKSHPPKICRSEQHRQPALSFRNPSLPPDPLTPRRRPTLWPSTARRAQEQIPSSSSNRELTTCFALDEFVKTGMGIRKSLDALVNNVFKGNATVIGEWVTASHVEHQRSRERMPNESTSGTEAKAK